MNSVFLSAVLLHSAVGVAVADGPVLKTTEWKGAIHAVDLKARTIAVLVVGKGIPENGRIVVLKLTDATKFVRRTADPRKFLDAKPEDAERGMHLHVLKNDRDEAVEIRLPALKR